MKMSVNCQSVIIHIILTEKIRLQTANINIRNTVRVAKVLMDDHVLGRNIYCHTL